MVLDLNTLNNLNNEEFSIVVPAGEDEGTPQLPQEEPAPVEAPAPAAAPARAPEPAPAGRSSVRQRAPRRRRRTAARRARATRQPRAEHQFRVELIVPANDVLDALRQVEPLASAEVVAVTRET